MRNALLIPMCLLFFAAVAADRGAWFPPTVHLTQTGQKAIVIYEDGTETLILSSEYEFRGTGKVVEFIPLPAKPEIREANYTAFEEIANLVNKHLRLERYVSKGRLGGESGISIEVQKTIKNHKFTVIKVNDAEEFADWMKARYGNLSQSTIEILQDYVVRGYNYIVVDEIQPSEDFASAIEYKFRSDKIWYPVKITKVTPYEGAHPKLQVFVISKYVPLPDYAFKYIVKAERSELNTLKNYVHMNEFIVAYRDDWMNGEDIELVPSVMFVAFQTNRGAPILSSVIMEPESFDKQSSALRLILIGISAGIAGFLLGRR